MKTCAFLPLWVLFLIALTGCKITIPSFDEAKDEVVVGTVLSVTSLDRDAAKKRNINTGSAMPLADIPDAFLTYMIETDSGSLLVTQIKELGPFTPTDIVSKLKVGERYSFRIRSIVMPSGTPIKQTLVVPFSAQQVVRTGK